MKNNGNMVSVVTCVYNESLLVLKKTVDSILNQTYTNIEFIIVVDNPEYFEAIELLKSRGETDGRITLVINEKNMGIPRSLNTGISKANGEYIARLDADDAAFPERIEIQLQAMKNNGYDLCASNVIRINEDDEVIENSDFRLTEDKKIKNILKYYTPLVHSSVMYKKSVWKAVGGYTPFYFCTQDYDFYLKLIRGGFTFGFIRQPLTYFRIRKSSVSFRKQPKQAFLHTVTRFANLRGKNFDEKYYISINDGTNPDYVKFEKAFGCYLLSRSEKSWFKRKRHLANALFSSKNMRSYWWCFWFVRFVYAKQRGLLKVLLKKCGFKKYRDI